MIRAIDFVPTFWAVVTIILSFMGASLFLWLSYIIAVAVPYIYFKDNGSRNFKMAMMALSCIIYTIVCAVYICNLYLV